MTWDAVAAIAEALGAIGVIATLFYLASQIRQAERATVASIQHSCIVQGFQLNIALAAPDTASLVLKASTDFGALDPVERLRFTQLFRAALAWYEDIHSQALGGVVDTKFWDRHRSNLVSLLRLPGIREWWHRDQGFFGDEFRAEVNRTLAA